MRAWILALLLLFASPALAVDQVISVTNEITDADCTDVGGGGYDPPWGGCLSNTTGTAALNGYDGADIAYAMSQCVAGNNCILELLPVTYENVAIDVDYDTNTCKTCGRNGGGYSIAQFAGGLEIIGQPGTILKSAVPLSVQVGARASVFEIRTGLFPATSKGFTFEQFECDGQTNKQPVYDQSDSIPYNRDTIATYHNCIGFNRRGSYPYPVAKMAARKLHVHHFFANGIVMLDGEGAGGGIVTDSEIHHIGVHQDFGDHLCTGPNTPDWGGYGGDGTTCCDGDYAVLGDAAGTCDAYWKARTYPAGERVIGEIPVGCDSGVPRCNGWNDAPEQGDPDTPISYGYKLGGGYGINFVSKGHWRAFRNKVHHVSKYAIAIQDQSRDYTIPGEERTGIIFDTSMDVLAYNEVYKAPIGLMCGTHCGAVTMLRNTAHDIGITGNYITSPQAIAGSGSFAYLNLFENVVLNSNGLGIGIRLYPGIPGTTFPNIDMTGNEVYSSNQWSGNGGQARTEGAAIYKYVYLSFPACDPGYDQWPMGMRLKDNIVDNTNDGTGGLRLAVDDNQGCPGNTINRLEISGGSYQGSGYSPNRDDIADILATNITTDGANPTTLLRSAVASQFRFASGSTGVCASGSFAEGGTGSTASVVNNGSVTGVSGGLCP